MGLFGLFGRKQKPRGPDRPPADRKAKAEARLLERDYRFLKQIETDNPGLYQDLMSERIKRRFGYGGGEASKDPLKAYKEMYKFVREVRDPSESTGSAVLRDALQALAPAVAAFLQTQQMHPPQQMYPPQVQPVAQPPAPAIAPPVEAASPPSEPALAADASAPVSVSATSQGLISLLTPLSPEQAAEWLCKQDAAFAKWLVGNLAVTPDERIPEFLAALAKDAPDLAGLVDWLRRRPDWLMALVHAVRARGGQQPGAASGF